MADRYTLTIDLARIGDPGAPGIFVAVEKSKAELVYPIVDAAEHHETLYPTRQQGRTDSDGVATFELLPSRLAGPYRVTVGSYRRTIWMPEEDAHLWQLPEFEGDAVMDPHAALGFMWTDLSNLDEDLSDEEKAAIRMKIGAGAGEGQGLTDQQAADLAGAANRDGDGNRQAGNNNRVRETDGAGVPVWVPKTPAPAVPAKASNTDVDGETDDADYMTVLKVFRAIARKVKNASATVRGIVLLARNEDVAASETDTSRVPTIAHVKALIARLAPEYDASALQAAVDALEALIGDGPLIREEADGNIPGAASAHVVAGVTVPNDANTAYALRLGGTTEFTLGNALRAARVGSEVEVGEGRFYSDGQGRLLAANSNAGALAFEVWVVRNLAAIRAVVDALGGTGAAFDISALDEIDALDRRDEIAGTDHSDSGAQKRWSLQTLATFLSTYFGLGSAASADVGTGSGAVPQRVAGGKLQSSGTVANDPRNTLTTKGFVDDYIDEVEREQATQNAQIAAKLDDPLTRDAAYAAVKAILVHAGSPGATADDAAKEIDILTGAARSAVAVDPARVERVNFDDSAAQVAEHSTATIGVAGVAVERGAGNAEIVTAHDAAADYFTLAAGSYFLVLTGEFRGSSASGAALATLQEVTRVDDDRGNDTFADRDFLGQIVALDSGSWQWSEAFGFHVADDPVELRARLHAERRGINYRNLKLQVVRWPLGQAQLAGLTPAEANRGYYVRRRDGEDPPFELVKRAVPGRAFLPDRDDPARGLEVLMDGADASWVLLTRAARARTLPKARILGDTSANYLDVEIPPELIQSGDGNNFTLAIAALSGAAHPAQAAAVNIEATGSQAGLRVVADTAGVGGNALAVKFTVPSGNHYPTAAWNGDTLEVTVTGNQRLDALIAVINAARRSGAQLVTASMWHTLDGTSALGWLRSGTHRLAGGAVAQASEPPSFEQTGTNAFRLKAATDTTLNAIYDAIAAFRTSGGTLFRDHVTLTGDGTDTIRDASIGASHGFQGGAEAEATGAAVDVSARHVTLIYEATTKLGTLAGASLPAGLSVALVHGTSRGALPPAPGFSEIFDKPPATSPTPQPGPSSDGVAQRESLTDITSEALPRTGAEILTQREMFNFRQYVAPHHTDPLIQPHIINPVDDVQQVALARTISVTRDPGLYILRRFVYEHQAALYGGILHHNYKGSGVDYIDGTWANPNGLCLFIRFRRFSGLGGKLEVALRTDVLSTYRQQVMLQEDGSGDLTQYGILDPALTGDTEDLRSHEVTLFGLHADVFAKSEAFSEEQIIAQDRHIAGEAWAELTLRPAGRMITYNGVHYTIYHVPATSYLASSQQSWLHTGLAIDNLRAYCLGQTNAQAQIAYFVQDNAPGHDAFRNTRYTSGFEEDQTGPKYPASYSPTPNQTGGCYLAFLYTRYTPISQVFPRTEIYARTEGEWVREARTTPEANAQRLADIHAKLPELTGVAD